MPKPLTLKNKTKHSSSFKASFKIAMVLVFSVFFLSGILTLITRRTPQDALTAIIGSLQNTLAPLSNDLFSCAARNDCPDDATNGFDGPQHKYIAQSYDKFGFPLAGVKYKWTKDDQANLLKFREINPAGVLADESSITTTENDQEIYLQPNDAKLENGTATVNILAYLDDPAQGKNQNINVDLYYCLNTWPNNATFPFNDATAPQSNPFTNFKTFYCKDRGNIIDPNDDYPALKVIERSSNTGNEFMCSGGGGNGLNCINDYIVKYNDINKWTKNTLTIMNFPVDVNIYSPTAFSVDDDDQLFFDGDEFAFWNGTVFSSRGKLTITNHPWNSWPDGQNAGTLLKPTAIGVDIGSHIILIEDNYFRESIDNGNTWLAGKTLAADGWPTDVQIPDDVSLFTRGVNNHYLLAMKDGYYRIRSTDNTCNSNLKCQTPSGRVWGSCKVTSDCSWGERFALSQVKEWPTTVTNWTDQMKFPVRTIAIDGATNTVMATSSCEVGGGVCLLKEFLLISGSACSDGIDNDGDTKVDLLDIDCTDAGDNSESGTCNDDIDNDNDGKIDYPADFSCDSYGDVEEEGCASIQCCNNLDDETAPDGLIDQQDNGCANKADNTEANECADGSDNDNDGVADLSDPGCTDATDNSEKGTAQCDDGIDNDKDGKTDFSTIIANTDFDCIGPSDDNESSSLACASSSIILQENFNTGLPVPAWTTIQTGGTANSLVWGLDNQRLYQKHNDAKGWFVTPTKLQVTNSYQISFDMGGFGIGNNDIGLVWNYIDSNNYYQFRWQDFLNDYGDGDPSRLVLEKKLNGSSSVLAEYSYIGVQNNLEKFVINVNDSSISISTGNKVVASYNDLSNPTILLNQVGFYAYDSDGGVLFDNLEVKACTSSS